MSEDLSHDAITHKRSWLEVFDYALDASMSKEDEDYWKHERKSLENFLKWFEKEHVND